MRRDKLTLRIAIMEAARTPKILTHLMNKTNMNGGMLKRELENLTTKNLVTTTTLPKETFRKYQKRKRNSKHPHYVLTPEGIELLNSLKNATVLME
jgi:predicted transcriptional regulator